MSMGRKLHPLSCNNNTKEVHEEWNNLLNTNQQPKLKLRKNICYLPEF